MKVVDQREGGGGGGEEEGSEEEEEDEVRVVVGPLPEVEWSRGEDVAETVFQRRGGGSVGWREGGGIGDESWPQDEDPAFPPLNIAPRVTRSGCLLAYPLPPPPCPAAR